MFIIWTFYLNHSIFLQVHLDCTLQNRCIQQILFLHHFENSLLALIHFLARYLVAIMFFFRWKTSQLLLLICNSQSFSVVSNGLSVGSCHLPTLISSPSGQRLCPCIFSFVFIIIFFFLCFVDYEIIKLFPIPLFLA